MKEQHSYRGHSIDLDLRQSENLVRCTYFIDQSYCFEEAAASFDVDTARASALRAAYRSIALLDAAKLSTPADAGVRAAAGP